MKDKNLLDDIESKSFEELNNLVNDIIDNLEQKSLEDFVKDYQELIKLNNFIEKNFKMKQDQYLKTKEKIEAIISNGKKLKKISKKVNYYLNSYLSKFNSSNLIVPMKYGLFSGGKKIRSKIIFDVGKIFNVKKKNLLILAASVEAIHAYSLIHDDLPCMDNDKLRRGKPSTHIKFGESTAILAGNSLLTTAFEILSDENLKVEDKIKAKLINFLSRCSGQTGIAGGQYLDLSYEKKKVSLQKILNMELKKDRKVI